QAVVPAFEVWLEGGERLVALVAPLARGDLAQRLALRRALDVLVELGVKARELDVLGQVVDFDAIHGLLDAARALDPAPAVQARLALGRLEGSAGRLQGALPPRDPAGWSAPLPARLRLRADALWFVVEPTLERSAAGERAAA